MGELEKRSEVREEGGGKREREGRKHTRQPRIYFPELRCLVLVLVLAWVRGDWSNPSPLQLFILKYTYWIYASTLQLHVWNYVIQYKEHEGRGLWLQIRVAFRGLVGLVYFEVWQMQDYL